MPDEMVILDEIKGLSLHYPARKLAPKDHARWLGDFVTDLVGGGFNESDVAIACRNWRTSDAKKMPTPGELLAYCRKVFRRPDPNADVIPIPKAPPRPEYSEEHKADMRERLGGLVGEMTLRQKDWRRYQGETDSIYANRLWPDRRIDRVRAALARRADDEAI